jgi:hypothetical protein
MKKIPSRLSLAKKTNALSQASAFTIAFLLFSVAAGFAQCSKDVVLTSSKTEYLNAEGAVQRTVEEECVIKVGKSEVTISPIGHDKMIGSLTSTACEWKQPFKVGKTTLEARFKNDNGAASNATITIEGKAGKITCVMKEKEKPDRIIRVTVDKFEEQK